MSFKNTFQRCIVCHVLKQNGAAILKKRKDKFTQRSIPAKSYEYLQTLGK